MLHHYSFNWSNIESLPANYFLIYSDHFRLHFHKIRQKPADNQLGDHGDLWYHCFPEGIVSKASPNHIWFQCLRHGGGLQINAYCNELTQNWNCPIFFYKWYAFYVCYQIEHRKGILWVKASEGTAMPCETTRRPQHGMGNITIKVLIYNNDSPIHVWWANCMVSKSHHKCAAIFAQR